MEAVTDYRTDTVFALAELSYLAGMRARSKGPARPGHCSSPRVFMPTNILSDERLAPPDPYDRRFRLACDLYNSALPKP